MIEYLISIGLAVVGLILFWFGYYTGKVDGRLEYIANRRGHKR